jgi:hypothetical protein
VDDWVKVAEHTVKKLMPLNLDEPVPQEIVDDVINFSEKVKEEALAAGKYQGFPFRYQGELRNYGPMLVRSVSSRKRTDSEGCAGMGREEIHQARSVPNPVPCMLDVAALPRGLEEVLGMRSYATPRGLRGQFELCC